MRSPKRPNALLMALVFGVLPCALGVGFGQYLRWRGVVWLTDIGSFWPLFCFATSLAAAVYLVLTKVYDGTLRTSAWLMLTWTWFYFPFWLTAVEVPKTSAVIGTDGRVSIVSETVRADASRAWLFAGRGGSKIIRNAEGTATINAVDVQYKFAPSHIASCGDEEDLSQPVLSAMTAALATEVAKPRSLRVSLFESKDAREQFLASVCRTVAGSKTPCPLKMTILPSAAATAPGGLWSKHFTESEAIDEGHIPTLITLLTQDNSRLAQKDTVYSRFMELAKTSSELVKVALKPHVLDDDQFSALIRRIIDQPDGGNDALSLYTSVTRLTPEQREALRGKAFQEAGIAHIIRQYGPGRISDSELAQLATRLRAETATNAEAAILMLEAFGPRLPLDLQTSSVDSIARSHASHALSALRYLEPTSPLRAVLLQKVIAEATQKDLDAKLSKGKLEELLAPSEARSVIASVVGKTGSSSEWVEFAARGIPARAMTAEERKRVIDELMFSSPRLALEFVSENRQHLAPSDVLDVTRDYARTIAADHCLHLTHRNANRQIDYFSDAQIKIFQACADAK